MLRHRLEHLSHGTRHTHFTLNHSTSIRFTFGTNLIRKGSYRTTTLHKYHITSICTIKTARMAQIRRANRTTRSIYRRKPAPSSVLPECKRSTIEIEGILSGVFVFKFRHYRFDRNMANRSSFVHGTLPRGSIATLQSEGEGRRCPYRRLH